MKNSWNYSNYFKLLTSHCIAHNFPSNQMGQKFELSLCNLTTAQSWILRDAFAIFLDNNSVKSIFFSLEKIHSANWFHEIFLKQEFCLTWWKIRESNLKCTTSLYITKSVDLTKFFQSVFEKSKFFAISTIHIFIECGNFANSLSQFFGNKFVNPTFWLNKINC